MPKNSPWLPAALTFVALSALYVATLCPTVGPGDSGELATALSTWGIPHPPAFPLLALLGNLVTHLPHPGEPALMLNLMNVLFAAAACGVLAHAVGVATGERWAGVVAGLALGTSRVFWDYALVLEVFSLNALFAAALLDLWVIFWRDRGSRAGATWTVPAAAAVMAGAITHHTTLALIAAPLVVMFAYAIGLRGESRRGKPNSAPSRWKTMRRAGLVGVLALTPLLYMYVAAHFDPPLNWGNPRSASAVLDVLLRRDFGTGTLMSPSIVVGKVLIHGESASPLGLRHLRRLVTELPHELGWPTLALALVGLAWCAGARPTLLTLTLLFGGAVAWFYSRVNAPLIPLYLGITRPFSILPHLYLAFLGGLGMAWALNAARRRGALLAPVLIGVAIAVTAGVSVAVNLRAVSQRGNVFTRDFGWNFMSGMPDRTLVFSNGDYFRNTFHYVHYALGIRPDLDLVEQPFMSRVWYVDQLRRRATMSLPPGMQVTGWDSLSGSRAWLDLNLGARPIVTVGFMDTSWTRGYDERPMGLWTRIIRRDSSLEVGSWAREYAEVVRGWRTESLARTYGEETWENEEGRYYPYALGSLRALLDVAALLGEPAPPPVPALAVAERWTGKRRAQYLADQGDLWRRFLTDWSAALTPAQASTAAERAVTLARASLAVDSLEVQGLQTLAAVMSAGRENPAAARFGDPFAEAAIRHRIVQSRPGDYKEMASYLALVRSLAHESDPRVEEILRVAEWDRRRYQDLLEVALRIWPSPILARRLRVWETPVTTLP